MRIWIRILLLMSVLIAIMAGALLWDYNMRRASGFVYIGAFFSLGIVGFFGFLLASREVRTPVGKLQDGDVRFAITASFVSVFFAMLSFFLFAPEHRVSDFAASLSDSFLTLTAVIVGFYFATSGALEFVRIVRRETAEESHDQAMTDEGN